MRVISFQRMKLSTKVFLGFFTILLLLIVVFISYYRLSDKVNRNISWLSKSESILRISGKLQREIIDMENGFRGYLLTGNENFLEPYNLGDKDIPLLFKSLKTQLNYQSHQYKRLDSIEYLHTKWVADYANLVIDAKSSSLSNEDSLMRYQYFFQNELKKEVGKKITDKIKRIFTRFNQVEYSLRQRRNASLLISVKETRQTTLGITLFSAVVGLACTLYITKTLSSRINEMVSLAGRISEGNFTTPINDQQRDELSNLSISLDKMAHSLNENFGSLSKKNKELDQFAYVVSHDLKAPLRGIDNVLIWMKEDIYDSLPETANEYLSMIKKRVLRLENHIEGLLEFSRVGRVSNVKEEVDVKALLLEIIDLYSPLSDIKIHLVEPFPILVTERVYLEQVFSNLISNGIKHHHSNTGNIHIYAEEYPDYYKFKVADDGPGIEQEYHDRIFQIFQTLKERDAFESNGVGLAIVKKIVEENKGVIGVVSALGAGATFVFTWPKV